MTTLSLFFTNEQDPQLLRTVFKASDTEESAICVRGKDSGVFKDYNSFQWTKAVKACAAVLVGYKDDKCFLLKGEAKSLAASFDYALSKKPLWLLDMFGCMPSGTPLTQRIFIRRNSERKSPGPVTIGVNSNILSQANLTVYLDEKPLTGIKLNCLLHSLTRSQNVNFERRRVSKESLNAESVNPAILIDKNGELLAIDDKVLSSQKNAKDKLPPKEFYSIVRSVVSVLANCICREELPLYFEIQRNLSFFPDYNDFTDIINLMVSTSLIRQEGKSLCLNSPRVKVIEKGCPSKKSISQGESRIGDRFTIEMKIDGSFIEMSFVSLNDLDCYFRELHLKYLSSFGQEVPVTGSLAHSWWPLIMPESEKATASSTEGYQNISYVRAGDTAIDTWVSNAYDEMGVTSRHLENCAGHADFWIYGDDIIQTILPKNLKKQIEKSYQKSSSILDFDKEFFVDELFQSSFEPKVLISRNSTLADSMRQEVLNCF